MLQRAARPLSFRVAIARDPAKLEALRGQLERSDSDVAFQQFVSGRVVNVCLFAVGGRIHCMNGYQSVRRTLHEGIARDIVDLRPDIVDHSSAIIRALDWTGVAQAQFLIEERDDLLQLVRYWFGGRPPCVNDRGRLATTREVLWDLRPAVKSDVWRRDDPWPAFQDLLDTFRPSKRR